MKLKNIIILKLKSLFKKNGKKKLKNESSSSLECVGKPTNKLLKYYRKWLMSICGGLSVGC